jgi:hypothetical protein
MPPDYKRSVRTKGKKVDHIKYKSFVEILMEEIYNNETLKEDIDFALTEHQKIIAIKTLRSACQNLWSVDGDYKSKFSLRDYKDTIDKYYKRFIVTNKISLLLGRIERWSKKNGKHKISKVNLKDKTGQYIYKYTDRKMVEDTLGKINNDIEWFPSKQRIEKYNKLWKHYV